MIQTFALYRGPYTFGLSDHIDDTVRDDADRVREATIREHGLTDPSPMTIKADVMRGGFVYTMTGTIPEKDAP